MDPVRQDDRRRCRRTEASTVYLGQNGQGRIIMGINLSSNLSSNLNRLRGSLKGKPLVTITRHVRGAQMYDRKVKRKADRAKRQALIRQATYCKTVARRMLKPAKHKKSTPGSPPRLRGGSKLFRLSVQWGYNNRSNYAVVGPVQVTNRDVPEALESGGMSTAIKRIRKPVPGKSNKRRSKAAGRRAKKGRFRSGNRKLAFKSAPRGPVVKTRQKVKARPFMVPAQKITLSKFADQFKGTFK